MDIDAVFRPFGSIEQILVNERSKRIAVVSFVRKEDAMAAKEALGGQKLKALDEKVLFINYGRRKLTDAAFDDFLRIPNVSTDMNIDCVAQPSLKVPGLYVHYDYISEAQEQRILDQLDNPTGSAGWTRMSSRNVQHFGYAFDYKKSRCDATQPLPDAIPDSILPLMSNMPENMGTCTPDQITANDYAPGQGIADHIDTHSAFEEGLGSLSLNGTCVMDFKNGSQSHSVALPRRSLLIMTGAARYQWTHGIQNRKTDLIDGHQVPRDRRVSLSFRTLRSKPCACVYPDQCDSQAQVQAESSRFEGTTCPTDMEQKYVHDFYETIASHFSSTRHSPWPRVATFLRELPPGSLVADIGCGNGKYLQCLAQEQDKVGFGGDRSASLVKICRERDFEVMILDAMAVPIRSASVDVALSIAVLHHLSTRAHRLAALAELCRILVIGGQALVYAWAQDQGEESRRKFVMHKQDIIVPWQLSKKFFQDDGSSGNSPTSDTSLLDPVEETKTIERYCHVYYEGELEELLSTFSNVQVLESYYDHSNWCVRLCKRSEH